MGSRLFVVGILCLLSLGLASASVSPSGLGPSPPHSAPGTYSTSRHVDTATQGLYTAETLGAMRWDVGATQERWLGRPFWIEPVTGRGVRVAIVDTGIDPSHPDLQGSVVAWRDFVHGVTTPYDDDTHGTHVAGIVAAHGHLQWRPDRHYFPFGARGIAPDVELIVAKAMDREGDGDASHVAKAILWALDPNGDGDYSDGAHIINLSIGLETPPSDDGTLIPGPVTLPALRTRTPEEESLVRSAIDTAVRAGAVVIVAAGNHEAGAKDSRVTFPGTLDNVITVAALDTEGAAASFSNEGAPGSGKPDLAAPGILLSTFPSRSDDTDSSPDGYVALGGTSMAAPVVAGTVALMMEADPSLRGLSRTQDLSDHTDRVRDILVSTADPVGSGFNSVYGHGVLRVDAAVNAVDQGNGPPNWDFLLLILLLIGLVGLLVWRKRRANQRKAAKREEMMQFIAEPVDDDVSAMPDPWPGVPPAEQRPPWDG